MLPIIDTHQHLWDLNRLDMPWLESAPTLNRSYVTSDYLAATAGLNVVKAVYMEVDVTAAQKVGEAEHLIELCAAEDNPTVGAVIGGSVTSADFAGYIRRFAGSPAVKGVRQVLHGPRARRRAPAWRPSLWRMCGCWASWGFASTCACGRRSWATVSSWRWSARRPALWLTIAATATRI